jgi:ribonuclease HI
VSPPVLRAPKAGNLFKMYIAAQERVIGAVLLQEEDVKEFLVAYVSRRLLDAETCYVFMEKLCLSLYYACSKFRHYILSSFCVVACQCDVIKHMLLKPILSGRIGKWAYALVEYDLAYEPLRSMKWQVVADFIVDHAVEVNNLVSFVQLKLWELFFEGSVCSKGQGAGCVIVSPNSTYIDLSIRLEFACTNNQVEHEAFLHGIEYLRDLGERDIDVFGDSNLIVQQVRGDSQCLYGVLNSSQDRCLDIIKLFDTFNIKHIPWEENSQANRLAQQASGYIVNQGVFSITSISLIEHRYALRSRGKLITENSDRLQVEGELILDNTNRLPQKTGPESGKTELISGKTEPTSGKIDPIPRKIEWESGGKIGLREEAKPTLIKKFQEESVTKQDEVEKDQSPLDKGKMKPISEDDSVTGGDTIQTDWRFPLLECQRNPEKTMDKKVKRQVLKYMSLHGDLYRRTIDGVLLKCLGEEHAKVAAQEVHDGIC